MYKWNIQDEAVLSPGINGTKALLARFKHYNVPVVLQAKVIRNNGWYDMRADGLHSNVCNPVPLYRFENGILKGPLVIKEQNPAIYPKTISYTCEGFGPMVNDEDAFYMNGTLRTFIIRRFTHLRINIVATLPWLALYRQLHRYFQKHFDMFVISHIFTFVGSPFLLQKKDLYKSEHIIKDVWKDSYMTIIDEKNIKKRKRKEWMS